MEDLHDIVLFPFNGEKILGLVLKHYDFPLADFYIIYAEHALYEYHNQDDCSIIAEDVIMPACDEAISDYKLKKEQIKNIVFFSRTMGTLIDGMQHMDKSEFL